MISVDIFVTLVVVLVYFIYWVSVFIIFYHLTRFGVGILPKRVAAMFFVGAVSIFLASVIVFSKIDLGSVANLLPTK